jgi:hypothetical protein
MAAAPHAGAHTEPRFDPKNQIKSTEIVALHFRKNATPHRAKSITYNYTALTRSNCRRWAKAVQIGARLAAVSDPVAAGLNGLSHAVVNASVPAGAAMPKFIVTCNGRTASCTCKGTSACRTLKGYDSAAMKTVVFGRGSSSCSDAKSADVVGMCDIFSRITPANVVIVYTQTGLGYAGRPGGPTPTITVSLQDLPFRFFFLRGLMGFHNLQIPASNVSTTAEDLASHAPSF